MRDVLSPRERQIYDNNKPRVDSLVSGFGIILFQGSIRLDR